ncbi:MAG: hypothetical protein AAFW84_02050 [Cyanobacteria bacterium J06635_15]
MTPESSAHPSPDLVEPLATAVAAYPPNLFVSLATPAMLLGLVLGRSLADAIQQVGLASEEIFRGDRLPILTVTATEPPSAQSPANADDAADDTTGTAES